ncbi:hypothetical protein A3F62_04330 [Candidatus Woesebacteria bacterium RIFCSPHIGHO2_12_FULL_44_11]|nr:MAG: hypothetical protein A3F62_04330 [Candidatus Woesebacteria bacterium RIFCSPHIGHO2_12_FULL_44_11]
MEYSDFVSKYKAGQIEVLVDRNKAGFMYQDPGLLPQNLRKKQVFIRTGAFVVVLLGIVMFVIAPWWLALIVLLVGLFMFPYAQKSGAKDVLAASLADSRVYQVAVDNQVLVLSEKTDIG